ncbi:Sodium-independent sulfate anion transporter [Eumeta japonica]|uniref:Sodium-independent sulfate anion transporter n=1 Tax=Eumeta variegata TaxID=151549 RepID=A0A4C1X838_EUMVA|nr:Sodium-independent sulfate anion transporter [Eumeta japonica]
MLKNIKLVSVLDYAFPIVRWGRHYSAGAAVGDLIAGVTVALTLIPQSIAYASLAGLQPQYGLYASFAGGFVYAVTGSCPQINIGPTALLSLLTFTYTNGTNPDFAVLLCFIGGLLQLVAGAAQLGFLVEFVSLPVVSGFTSAAAVTIASSQIKGLLGLKFSAETFVATWKGIYRHIADTRLPDTLLSFACCILLLGMKALKDIRVKDPQDEKAKRNVLILQRSLWVVGVARNAVVVVLAAVVAYFVHVDRENPLILTGNITPGLPTPQVPPFRTTAGNTTYSATEMLGHLGSGLIVVPLVGIIANVAIAKAFSGGRTLNATQEIIALGMCNAVGSFFRSFPVNGSFTRSAVSDASGVRTPAAGFYTGIIVLMTLGLLTPYFYYIPRAALAAVIVCAVLHMVDLQIIRTLWRTSRFDLIPLVGSFVLCLALGIELGLVCGVGVDVVLLLYYHSRPPLNLRIVNDNNLPPHYEIYPVGGLHFPGAEKVRAEMIAARSSAPSGRTDTASQNVTQNLTTSGTPGDSVPNGHVRTATTNVNMPQEPIILVVRCDKLYRIDYTFLQSLKALTEEWSRGGPVLWCEANAHVKDKIRSVLSDPLFCDSSADLRNLLADLVALIQPAINLNKRPAPDVRVNDSEYFRRKSTDINLCDKFNLKTLIYLRSYEGHLGPAVPAQPEERAVTAAAPGLRADKSSTTKCSFYSVPRDKQREGQIETRAGAGAAEDRAGARKGRGSRRAGRAILIRGLPRADPRRRKSDPANQSRRSSTSHPSR